MAFPSDTSDGLIDPTALSYQDDATVVHHDQDTKRNTLLRAIRTKLGIDSSTDPNSFDYQIRRPAWGDIQVEWNGTTWDTYDLKVNRFKKANAGAANLNAAMTYVKTVLGTSDSFSNGGRVFIVTASHNGIPPIEVPVNLRNCHCYDIWAEGDAGTNFQVQNVAAMQGNNNVSTTITSSPGIGATSFTIASAGSGTSAVPTSNFWVAFATANEKVFCTSRSGLTITCEALTKAHSSGETVWSLGHTFAFDLRRANRIRFNGFNIDTNNVQGCGGFIQVRIKGGQTGGASGFSRVWDNSVRNCQAEAFSLGDYGDYIIGEGTSNAYWDRNNVFDNKPGSNGFGDGADHNRAQSHAMYASDWHVSEPQINRPGSGIPFGIWGSTGQLSGNSGHIASSDDYGPIVILAGSAQITLGTNIYLDNVGSMKTTIADAAGITSGQTTLTLAEASNSSGAVGTAPLFLRVEDEWIKVGARSGVNCSSLTRGARGTTAATHALGVAVYTDIHAITIKPPASDTKVTRLMISGEIYINGNAEPGGCTSIVYADLSSAAGAQLRQCIIDGIHGTGASSKPTWALFDASHSSRVDDLIIGGTDQVAQQIIGKPLGSGADADPVKYRRMGVNRIETSAAGPTTLSYATDAGTGRVSGTLSKTNSVAFTDVCSAVMSANCRYKIRGWVFFDAGTTGELKLKVNGPAGASGTIKWVGPPASVAAATDPPTVQTSGVGTAVTLGALGVGTTLMVAFEGFVKLGPTGGPVNLQYSQAVSNGTATSIFSDTGFEIESVEV